MPKFRKKPVVIEAFRMGMDPRPDWFQDKVSSGEITTHALEERHDPFEFVPTNCDIQTLEGVMRGDYGDYIIQGVKGEIYPCKPDIFEATYEPINGAEQPTKPFSDIYVNVHLANMPELQEEIEKFVQKTLQNAAG